MLQSVPGRPHASVSYRLESVTHRQGKVERFHQTLKKHLAKQDPVATKRQLQGQLDRFVAYYHELRPHRALRRRTPLEAFTVREKALPSGPNIDTAGYRVRRDKVDKTGSVTLRYTSRLHHIGIGRAYAGWRVILLVAGRDVRILGIDGPRSPPHPGDDKGLPASSLTGSPLLSTMS